jgi:hypothetical protein
MKEQPKLKIFNLDGTVTEVVPNKLWSPCKPDKNGNCIDCGKVVERT